MDTKKATNFFPSARLNGFDKPTVWHEFTPLAQQYKAINLGQGFPDWSCEPFVKDAGNKAIYENHNQYARPQGHMNLVNEISKKYSKILNRKIDPLNEVVCTVGATEGIYAAFCSILNEGDEVVLFEPSFDIYRAQVQMAGGVCKYVPMEISYDSTRYPSFTLNMDKFRNAFNSKTRIFLLNNPHNPTGKVFSKQELIEISQVVLQYPNVVVVSDEVYEHILFDDTQHYRIADIVPEMWERTLTISSAGKTFSVTGWKIGWAIGPVHLIRGISLANNWIQFSVTTPLQEAIANVLLQAELPYKDHSSFYEYLAQQYQGKRDRLMKALEDVGIKPFKAMGGIFLYANISSITIPDEFVTSQNSKSKKLTKDWLFCRWITIKIGITAIPASAFYSNESKELGKEWVRFAFCKEDHVLVEAFKRLQLLANFIG